MITMGEGQRLLFWCNVKKTNTCWLWTGGKSKGYGRFTVSGRQLAAHRISYQLSGRVLADRDEVHHICEVKACIRPDHLVALNPGSHRAEHSSSKRVVYVTRPDETFRFDPDRFKYRPLLFPPLRRITGRDPDGREVLECRHVIDASLLSDVVKRRKCFDCQAGRKPAGVR